MAPDRIGPAESSGRSQLHGTPIRKRETGRYLNVVRCRDQQGRSVLTISELPNLMVIDPRTFPDDKLKLDEDIFVQLSNVPLLPANESYRDTARQSLDRSVLIELLALPEKILEPLDNVRRPWCAEPSVHGGKSNGP